jgi:hypothetical protein
MIFHNILISNSIIRHLGRTKLTGHTDMKDFKSDEFG